MPRWLRFGSPYRAGIGHSAFKLSDGKLHHGYWSLHWRWGGDTHQFMIRPSLGTHMNHSERARRDQAAREFNHEFDLDDADA